jgi:metal transporter CNNM
LLLVTLLLFNAAANEALPVFLSRLMPETHAIILSVTCVLLFGEILPSAVFTGKAQLAIAAALVPLVRCLIVLSSPIAWPISKVLDWLLGEDHDVTRYKRKELKALVALQQNKHPMPRQGFMARFTPARRRESRMTNGGGHYGSFDATAALDSSSSPPYTPPPHQYTSHLGTHLHVDEVTIIHGALDLSTKTVLDVMVPWYDVFMLEIDTHLDPNVLANILSSGFSRIPVYSGHRMNVVGLLLVKRLIVLDPEDARPIRDLMLKKPMVVSPDFSCYALLNEFQKGRSHMALITEDVDYVQVDIYIYTTRHHIMDI